MEDMLIARVRTYMQARWTKGGSYANWFCNGLCIEGQYTTHYKPNRTPSVLPVHAEFDASRYKAKNRLGTKTRSSLSTAEWMVSNWIQITLQIFSPLLWTTSVSSARPYAHIVCRDCTGRSLFLLTDLAVFHTSPYS